MALALSLKPGETPHLLTPTDQRPTQRRYVKVEDDLRRRIESMDQ
jgi:hypothetical protein